MTLALKIERQFSATRSAVYRAFTTPGGQMDWFANAAEIDARVGGRFYVWTEKGYQAMGTFTSLEEDRRLVMDLFNPEPGRLQIEISEENGATHLLLEQHYLKDPQAHEAARAAWEDSLENLKSVLERGIDRRFYDRPMLGVLIGGAVDRENFKRYRLPEPTGIILAGTVSGMGAEAAGLQENDVLVEMDGIRLDGYHALQQAIRPHTAGDIIPIAWYRGGERHTADMPLSGRPIPEVPSTPAGLADQVQEIYARLEGELAEILEDVTEEAADFRPAESEWSVKEILSHLILSERALQMWITNTADGRLMQNWGGNDPALVKSLVDIHPMVQELTAELQRSEAQTVALVRRLPPEIVDYRGAFHNIATMIGSHGMAIHTRLHFETIQKQIEAFRQLDPVGA